MVATKSLLTTRQVAEFLSLSRYTIYKLVQRNVLRPVFMKGIGRTKGMRFRQDDLESYVAQSRRRPAGV